MFRHSRGTFLFRTICLLTLAGFSISPLSRSQAQAKAQPETQAPLVEPMSNFGGFVSAVAVRDDLAYITQGSTFKILDISDPQNLTAVGSVYLPDFAVADRIRLSGNRAAVISTTPMYNFKGMLAIIDVTNPFTPTVLYSHFPSWFSDPYGPVDLALQGDLLFQATELGGLRISSLNNPDVWLYNQYDHDALYFSRAVEVTGTLAYLLTQDSLIIYDVSDPSNPLVLSTTPVENASDLEISGNIAYVSTSTSGYCGPLYEPGEVTLQILDVSDPGHPLALGDLAFDSCQGGGSLRVADGWAYLENGDGANLIDISNPVSPQYKATFSLDIRDPDIAGDRLYQVDLSQVNKAGLGIYALQNPAPPVQIGHFSSLNDFTCVRANQQALYVGESNQILHVFNIQDPTQPQWIISFDNFKLVDLCKAKFNGDRAYTPDYVYDISDPFTPKLLYQNYLANDFYYDLAIDDNKIYALGNLGLSIFDISTPDLPQMIGQLANSYPWSKIAASYGIVYVADPGLGIYKTPGLQTIDATNPAEPKIIGSVGDLLPANRMLVVDHYVILVGSGFWVIDARSPAYPRIAISWGGTYGGGVYDKGLLFISGGGGSITILDAREPGWMYDLEFNGDVPAGDVQNGMIYAADWRTGLQVYQLMADRLPPKLTIRHSYLPLAY
jgi:hypothetical protein